MMEFLDILFEIYMVVFTVVAAFAIALAPYIIVLVFEISSLGGVLNNSKPSCSFRAILRE